MHRNVGGNSKWGIIKGEGALTNSVGSLAEIKENSFSPGRIYAGINLF